MKLIGIIGAMEVEVASLKEMMTDVTIRTKASMEFNHGYLNGKEVVVVRSGIGKVNAGICTQCNKELFFSYRAENGKTGRMGVTIWKK